MPHPAVPAVLNDGELLTLQILEDLSLDRGSTQRTAALIARRIGQDAFSVRLALANLEAEGHVVRYQGHRITPTGRQLMATLTRQEA